LLSLHGGSLEIKLTAPLIYRDTEYVISGKNVLSSYDPDPLDPQDFGFLDHRFWLSGSPKICGSGFKGQNINQKLQKIYLFSKPKSELFKNERS